MRMYCRHFTAMESPFTGLALAVALICCASASCSPSVPGPQAGGGIGGTGSVSSVSSGPITKLSSVYVSGTEYDNSNALYCIDGEPCSTDNRLKLGMVVLVTGTADQSAPNGAVSRVAHTITFEETVEGVVQSIAPDGSSLIVLGQFIALNQKTVIDASIPGQSVRNLTPGIDVIEVSGLVAGDGHILATLIMKQTGTPQYEVQGVIKNHDPRAKRFEIGQLMVDYSSTDVSDIATVSAANWDGRLVHIRGDQWRSRTEVPYGAELTAIRVKPLGLTVEDSADAKMEGFITQVPRPGIVLINNHPIEVSAATTFAGGTANDLTLGAHVFVHGALIQGVLKAHEVVLKENIHIESNVESVDFDLGTLSLAGFTGLFIETHNQTVI